MGNELQFELMVYEKYGIIWTEKKKKTDLVENKTQLMQHML